MFQGVEATTGYGLSGYHGIEGEVPSTVINHQPQIGGVRFRDRVDRHTVHPGKEIRTKGGREPTGGYFNIALRPQELSLPVGLRRSMRLIVGGGERGIGRRPGPKTFGKTAHNGLDKGWIRVVAQQPVKD